MRARLAGLSRRADGRTAGEEAPSGSITCRQSGRVGSGIIAIVWGTFSITAAAAAAAGDGRVCAPARQKVGFPRAKKSRRRPNYYPAQYTKTVSDRPTDRPNVRFSRCSSAFPVPVGRCCAKKTPTPKFSLTAEVGQLSTRRRWRLRRPSDCENGDIWWKAAAT